MHQMQAYSAYYNVPIVRWFNKIDGKALWTAHLCRQSRQTYHYTPNTGNHPALGDAEQEAYLYHYNDGDLCGYFVPGMTGSVTTNVKVAF